MALEVEKSLARLILTKGSLGVHDRPNSQLDQYLTRIVLASTKEVGGP
jgi:hypothetical protein